VFSTLRSRSRYLCDIGVPFFFSRWLKATMLFVHGTPVLSWFQYRYSKLINGTFELSRIQLFLPSFPLSLSVSIQFINGAAELSRIQNI
jgi:hypothetical protein